MPHRTINKRRRNIEKYKEEILRTLGEEKKKKC